MPGVPIIPGELLELLGLLFIPEAAGEVGGLFIILLGFGELEEQEAIAPKLIPIKLNKIKDLRLINCIKITSEKLLINGTFEQLNF